LIIARYRHLRILLGHLSLRESDLVVGHSRSAVGGNPGGGKGAGGAEEAAQSAGRSQGGSVAEANQRSKGSKLTERRCARVFLPWRGGGPGKEGGQGCKLHGRRQTSRGRNAGRPRGPSAVGSPTRQSRTPRRRAGMKAAKAGSPQVAEDQEEKANGVLHADLEAISAQGAAGIGSAQAGAAARAKATRVEAGGSVRRPSGRLRGRQGLNVRG
jgi:hypothetical protein